MTGLEEKAPALSCLYGIEESHLVTLSSGAQLGIEVQQPFELLVKATKDAGFDLQLASSFRAFSRQLAIWNNKFDGLRPILDIDGNLVDIADLDDWQKCQAILLFSALPGASRHHWGTDFDYFDANALPQGYQLQLIDKEYLPPGPCAGLQQWLEQHAARFGFFFPYRRYHGGIAPEPWHLSYRPLAETYLTRLQPQTLAELLTNTEIKGKQALIDNIEEVVERFVMNISTE